MLAEIAGLGFIGVFLQVIIGLFGESVEELSEAIFGDEEGLIESFEWLHTKLFEVAVAEEPESRNPALAGSSL